MGRGVVKKEKWERNGGFNYHIYGNELANLRNWNGIVSVREKMEISKKKHFWQNLVMKKKEKPKK